MIVEEYKDRYHERTLLRTYNLLHETVHHVWSRDHGGSLEGQFLDINRFATELMVYGAMAVSGYVDEKGISGYLPEAFGPDHKFYQTLLHEKMMAAVGQAFVNQFSHRTSYLNPYDKIILLPDSYHCMTPELADQLPQDLSYTSPAGLAAKIPLIGTLIDSA